MRFWIKIGLLVVVMYLACYVSFLVQDRRQHKLVVRDVEAATRSVILEDIEQGRQSEAKAKLAAAKFQLDQNEAQWRCDAHHLLLLSSAD